MGNSAVNKTAVDRLSMQGAAILEAEESEELAGASMAAEEDSKEPGAVSWDSIQRSSTNFVEVELS